MERHKLPHSFLISGPRGIGKGEAALWIAKSAVCEGEIKPCFACEPCRQFEKRSDLDLRLLRPVSMPFWIDADELERLLPERVAEGLDEMVRARFLFEPPARLERRIQIPLHLNPVSLFKKGKGSPRTDRVQFAAQVESSSLGEGEKATLTRIVSASFSLDWFISTIGIGHLTGDGDQRGGETGILPFLRRKPAGRRRKVVILEEAELMTEQAQNSLLKTLEEPPENSLLILTTTRRDGMFDTIRSRCEEVRLTPLPDDRMRSALGEYYRDLSAEEVDEYLQLAEGVPGRAAEADIDESRLVREALRLLIESARSGPFPDYFALLEDWTSQIEEGGGGMMENARRQLTVCLEIARSMAEEGSGVPFRMADRLFQLAHRYLSSIRPSTNIRLLMEEFGLALREILFQGVRSGAPRGEEG